MLPVLAPLLLSFAAKVGAPLVERVLSGKIGGGNAAIVGEVVRKIADHAGTTPEALPELAAEQPEAIERAIHAVEPMTPELIALYAAGLENQFSLLKAEMKEPTWTWAWRPIWMYGLLVLWFWNLVLLHVANAIWRIALPQTDLSMLLGVTSLFLALYMGGHTLKDVFAKRAGVPK